MIRNGWFDTGEKVASLMAVLALAAILSGCGGGGGGGGGNSSGGTTVTGSVLLVETNLAPVTAGTITMGGVTTTTNSTGGFALTNVPVNTTTGTVSVPGEQTLTLTLNLKANTINNLGTIYVSATGYTASANGRVVTVSGGVTTPVAGADVTIGGQSSVSATDGTFTIANLPVGLGSDPTVPIGNIQATGYVNKPILTQFPLAAGSNPLGDIPLGAPISSSTPSQPYTIFGFVKSGGAAASTTVSLSPTVGPLIAHTDPATGEYFFWVPAGTYTVTELSTGKTVTVTLGSNSVPVQATTINI